MDKSSKTVYGQWERLLAIDTCLQNRNHPLTIEEISERCNNKLGKDYSKRTYYNDIKILKDIFDAPIKSKKYQQGTCHFYSDDFSLKEQPVNSIEKENYEEALKQLIRFCAVSKDENSNAIYYRLRELFGFNEEPGQVMGYDTIRDDLSGREHLNPLFGHIVHRETLDLEYRAMNRDVKKWTVFPYYLKQFNRRWFLIARKADDAPDGRLMNYALDRILDYEVNKKVKYEESEIDFSTYYDDLYGVTFPEKRKIEKVIVLMDKKEFPYIESNPLCLSQDVIEEDDRHVTFSLDVYINYELKQKLLSYGSKLEVLEPVSLRDWMTNETKNMSEAYVCKSK